MPKQIPHRYRMLMFSALELLRKEIQKEFSDWKDADEWLFAQLDFTKEELAQIYEGRDVLYYDGSAVEFVEEPVYMTEKTFPIQEGQTVYISPTGNAARREDEELWEGTISKIARKYFYVDTKRGSFYTPRFERETFDSSCPEDCNSGYTVWESKESWYSFQDAKKELDAIRDYASKQQGAFFRNESGGEQIVHDLYQTLLNAGAIKED